MKSLALTLLLALAPLSGFAAIKGAPFIPEEDIRFDALENQVNAAAGISRLYAKAVYDVAVQGGSSTAHSLGVVLPAGAVLTGLYVYINTAFTQTGAGSVSLQCAGTNDLMDWQDLTVSPQNGMLARRFGPTLYATSLFGTNGSLVNTGAVFTPVNSGASIVSACTVNAVVRSAAISQGNTNGGNAQTAGKFTSILEYFIR